MVLLEHFQVFTLLKHCFNWVCHVLLFVSNLLFLLASPWCGDSAEWTPENASSSLGFGNLPLETKAEALLVQAGEGVVSGAGGGGGGMAGLSAWGVLG